MSLGNLCSFTLLAALVSFPAARWLAVEAKQPETQRQNSTNIDEPPAIFLPVQSKNPKDLGLGKLLVASRELGDPNFAQTVILLVHFDTESAVGLMLNRRADLPISRVLAQLSMARDLSDPVYLGGPVDTHTVFALLRSTNKLDGTEPVFGDVSWITSKAALEKSLSSHPGPDVFHVYLGYAGWTSSQLRAEVRLGSWFIFPADSETVFSTNPDSLWRQMIKKTELQMAGCRTPGCQNPTRQQSYAVFEPR